MKQSQGRPCNHLPRDRIKELRSELRQKSPQAAKELLAHSLRVGHRRLSVRRYIIACALGVEGLDEQLLFLRAITRKMKNEHVRQIVADVACKLDQPDEFSGAIEQLLVNGPE